ncbi:PDR/VanB family oxidoreductase [Arthrobacter sp. I2-34]|uniref:PDR/VanB family oxidoreductase n=1 Tax=Arthrobacter hankyongi TaxID=2904801 RepID=A0ABS9L3X9_9MICC|nr:PDR/VanB family oxidoreductase [Arthrobacter hankyongi]MCG2621341.1 PDR/VanB family oxidoreductase [Arthrobacter hankyongi]
MSEGFETMTLRVHAMQWEAETVLSVDLRDPNSAELPEFTAGAHIDLVLPNGITRSYSLSNDQRERHRYVVGVSRDAKSRGGSTYIHDSLRVGQLLPVSAPLNNFPLAEDAEQTILFAGGIGITPMLSMVRRLETLGRNWTLYYCVRERSLTAFGDELATLAASHPERLQLHVDAEHDGAVLDLAAVVDAAPEGTHMYCCGPLPMLEGFEKAAVELPSAQRHVEYFAAKDAPALEGGFEVELAQSGRTLTIEPGRTILDTMQEAGIDVSYSCGEGICGTCETRVLAGTPDHRDLVLTDQEKEANDIIMICCSGSKGPKLVLDR